MEAEEKEQYQLFETSQYKYRVFVTDLTEPIYFVIVYRFRRPANQGLDKSARGKQHKKRLDILADPCNNPCG